MMLSLLRWFFFFHATQSVLSSRPFRLGQWLPSDWNVTGEWLANVIHECQCKYKDKLEMILALHPQAEDNETALCALRSADTKITDKHHRLHKPVEDLKNAILTDPAIFMFFHQKFWQQYHLQNHLQTLQKEQKLRPGN